MLRSLVTPFFLPLLPWGCTVDPGTGPVEVTWDRDTCERCRMVISEREYAAEVRGGPRREIYKFDDIGDAILWLGSQSWGDDPTTEIWVAAHDDGHWINAYEAWFSRGHRTPMDFGLGASEEAVAGALDYRQAVEYVKKRALELEGWSQPK